MEIGTPHAGKRNALNQMARPVAVPWVCSKSGDCCRLQEGVVVSRNEQEILNTKTSFARRPLEWERFDLDPDRFVKLVTQPCPFLSDQNLCLVYEYRPFNCRRFMCGRVNVQLESFESGGPMGCFNLSDRIGTSLRFLEFYRSHEHHAQKWARVHGWSKPK